MSVKADIAAKRSRTKAEHDGVLAQGLAQPAVGAIYRDERLKHARAY
jgi:hypothetical protein